MSDFKLHRDTRFAIDLKGIAVVNKEIGAHLFIDYPEAAVWSILLETSEKKKSIEMLRAILGKSTSETNLYIAKCIMKWKKLNILD
jgi:hypothetical protein